MDRAASKVRAQRRPAGRSAAARLALAALAPALCCGCQLIGRERAVPKQMATSRELSQRGISALDRGEWSQGEARLARSIKACPTDAEPHRHYAEALWHRGAREEALDQMREAMRLSGEDPNLQVRVGEMCLELGHRDEAAKLAEDAIDLSPHSAAAWALRGEIAEARGRLDEALADMHRGLEFQHDDKKLLLLTAELYRRQGRPARALSALEALRDCYASGEEPQQVLYLQGLAFTALARYGDAVDVYTVALGRDRPTVDLYDGLAEAELLAKRPAEADAAVQHALALDPNHPPSLRIGRANRIRRSASRRTFAGVERAAGPTCATAAVGRRSKKPGSGRSRAFVSREFRSRRSAQQALQQTGVLPKLTVQQQPESQQVLQHSLQACRHSQHLSSPLVQVIFTPFLVYSQWQCPQVKLHWQTAMPL